MRLTSIFFILVLWMASSVMPVRAWSDLEWRIVGSQDENWEITEPNVQGYSQHNFAESYAVTDPGFLPVPDDFQFQFFFTPVQGVDHNFVWNFWDEENYTQAHVNGGAMWISQFINGQEMLSVAKPWNMTLGQTYAVSVQQVGMRTTMTINDVEVAAFDELANPQPGTGSVGFKLAPGAVAPVESRFESIHFHDANITLLPVARWRQTGDWWGEMEYDTASAWAFPENFTIGRWGCALTSLVMVMDYYGLVAMPDGQPMNPETVNAWLLTQPDGYVGEGLVNWFAATRLIREISERWSVPGHELPKLEFAFQNALNWQAVGREEILADQPFIAQVPGHFAVAHGFDQRNTGFLIQDPLYDYTYLSQHSSVLSLRLFRPSQTDLSAIMVAHPPSVDVSLQNAAGEVVSETWEEVIETPNREHNAPWRFTAVSQPEEEIYQLALSEADENIRVFAYDEQAALVELPIPDTFITGGSLFIHFQKDGEIFWTEALETPDFSWEEFLEALPNGFERLRRLAQFAQNALPSTWPRYTNYLRNIVNTTENIPAETRVQLLLLLE